MIITGYTATNTWLQLIAHLLSSGIVVRPHGLACYETLGLQTRTQMHKPIVTVPYRQLGYRFMFAEAWWILTGKNDVESIKPFSNHISDFSDNGETFFGAYGPKVVEQLPHVIQSLVKDQQTRQAVINIWRENPPPTKDTPCTLSVQFFIRDNKLNCIDTMRSSDAWLGWPYDTFNFSMVSAYIVLALKQYGINLKLGELIMNIGSSHLYRTDEVSAERCLDYEKILQSPRKFRYPILEPLVEWENTNELIDHLENVAKQRPLALKSTWVHCVAEGKHNKVKEETQDEIN